jgi:alkaline phosphatase
MKKIISTLLITATASFTVSAHGELTSPKNIIMVVGDGMGPAYTSAYRYFKDNPQTPTIEATVFDDILVGRASTYPAPVSGFVTDSAASGTALATGHKSYNGAIGVDANEKPQQSVLEFAKSIGKSTGLVVTSQINHATPASYAAHVKQRKMYNVIADQYFDTRINGEHTVDVMMGGGVKYFKRDDRDLTKAFKNDGYQYIDQYSQLATLNSDKVLGLFSDVGLPWALDDSQPHRLKAMTMAAIDRLDNNEEGFFMLIEGSQVDWGGHANDIAAAMTELDDLAVTIEWLKTYVKDNPDTLVVITADHSTGGFTIGANGDYAWRPAVIKNLKSSPENIAKTQTADKFDVAVINEQLGFELTKDEIKTLKTAHNDGKKSLYNAIKKVIDVRTNTGWTTSGHTGVDVPVFAFGSHKNAFGGQIDNTDIAKTIFKLLGK